MVTSTPKEIEKALIAAINEQTPNLRRKLESLPDRGADLVRAFMPVRTGAARDSVRVDKRKSELKKLSTRKTKLGRVYSDGDPKKMAAIEYGRHNGEQGDTPEFAPFRRAANALRNLEL
ncbi:hypothetical protein ACXPWS_07655 [Mycobacterium sp. BMJ-28]